MDEQIEKQQPLNKRVLKEVQEAILPVLNAHHVELFDLSMQVRQGAWTLRLTIDTPASASGAVSVDVCADVSRDVSMVLDVNEPIKHPYTLEVSSPGIERPLRSLQDCERFQGKLAKIVLHAPLADGQRVLRGHLGGVNDGNVVMLMEHGQQVSFAFSTVRKAQLVYEAPSQKKRSSTRRKKKKR